MASFMSSTFTTGERKKKIITYGKLSRLPPPRPSPLDDNAPSPERPHKHASTSIEPLVGPEGHTRSAQSSSSVRTAATRQDVFDVPSEDEFEFQPTTPAKRPVVPRSKAGGDRRSNFSEPAAIAPPHAFATAIRPPEKPVIARTVKPKTSLLQGQSRPRQSAQEKDNRPVVPPASTTSQTKASQVTEGLKRTTTAGPQLQRSNTSSKNTSRATSPGLITHHVSRSQSAKAASTIPQRNTTNSTIKPTASFDVFDVPSDHEEASVPIPRAPRQISRQTPKTPAKQAGTPRSLPQDASRKVPVESTDLGSLHVRKRKGSVSLTSTHKSITSRPQELSSQQPDRKVAKRKEGSSPGREATRAPALYPASRPTTAEATVNKARRARMRTVPIASQPPILKGKSSPAVLNKMLPVEEPNRTLREDSTAEIPASDDTMYDIPDANQTPARPTSLRRTTSSTPGSVTPRQKDLFSTLLGASAAPKTPASALASLQLTDRKPRSLLGALARSKSDVSLGSKSQKTRLLDSLKDEDVSSEEEDSESDDEADGNIITDIEMDTNKTPVQAKRLVALESNARDHQVNDTTATDSQNPQLASGAPTRPKLTYASQRSYLQEADTEDDFFMSMDLDDGWKMDSQNVSTDDEDGPTSQPRTHHELKKHGQNTMFSWDMEESVREISDVSNKSMRRSAMIELCTKMADAGFVSQLLDSGFMHKLLENMTSNGDVIFDFIAAVSVLFVLHKRPAFAIVDQIYRSGVVTTLIGLVDKEADILRIARDRKSNMSKIAQESLTELRATLLASKVWSSSTPEKISPQLLAFETIDILTRSLRESGNTEAVLSQVQVSKIVNVCSIMSKRVEAINCFVHDLLALDLVVSILETVSIADQDYSTWPLKTLQQLSDAIPVFFQETALSRTVEAMKLCMHLTNNKPKSCQPFSTSAFVGSLVSFVVAQFDRLDAGEQDPEYRTQVLANLTLSLGAMINLAELSDQARANAAADTTLIEILVKTFITGSKRAAEASSVEESEVGVVIGFLAVLLGMLCLNTTVRSQIQAQLPNQQLHLLLENMKQFARIHEHVDKKTASRFEGSEGQEALNNYYMRIMHVVEKLQGAKR
ncbi:rheb small monomeric gtpase [Stagonosporopsis vannaccii]|nr:rheb small monomeric gtpase [Stagonosporopsis vannaccii]